MSLRTEASGSATPLYNNKEAQDGPGLFASSKCRAIAFIACGVAGAIIIILGGINLFGATGSAGFIASITVGGALLSIAVGGLIWVVVCNCKSSESFSKSRSPSQTLVNTKTATIKDEVGGTVRLEQREIKREGFAASSVRSSYEGEIDGMPASEWLKKNNLPF